MLPITLVTGFLGTGKTTLLKKIVARSRDRKIVYLVNEFSPKDVDSAMVAADNPNVVSIPGGSIFCKCLVAEFIGQLKKVAAEWGDADGVVIEASGMANPKVIEQMLAETRLDTMFRLANIISVLDPNSFLKLRHTLPNIIAQIEAADIVVINKIDCNPAEKIAATAEAVTRINPRARQVRAVRCDFELELFPDRETCGLCGEYGKCRDPNYATFTTETAYDGDVLEKFITAHADDIYRVKGTLAGECFDYSTSGFTRVPQPGATPSLVWIVKGTALEAITLARLAL